MAKDKDDGGPAFPCEREHREYYEQGAEGDYQSTKINGHYYRRRTSQCEGMTLWDIHYALQGLAVAIGGWMPGIAIKGDEGRTYEQTIARIAADQADAMIAERAKRFGKEG